MLSRKLLNQILHVTTIEAKHTCSSLIRIDKDSLLMMILPCVLTMLRMFTLSSSDAVTSALLFWVPERCISRRLSLTSYYHDHILYALLDLIHQSRTFFVWRSKADNKHCCGYAEWKNKKVKVCRSKNVDQALHICSIACCLPWITRQESCNWRI